MSTQINIRNLHFSFKQNEPVLSDVNCTLNSGNMYGLIGPNGAGKSSLLKLILNILAAQQGTISINEKATSNFSRKLLAQQIAFVPQDTQINFEFCVEDIVRMGRNPYLGRFQTLSEQDYALVDTAIEKTELSHLRARKINTLSGGERQRVLIARAIAQNTPIILLDEATANLDIAHQLDVFYLCKQLSQEGKLVLAAIHDLNMAARFCDQLLLLAQKNIKAAGTPELVLSQENLKTFFAIEATLQNTDKSLSIWPERIG